MKYLRSFTGQLHGKKLFSKIGLTKSYHQIPIAEEDRHKTAVITPWGLFDFNRLPMGLANSAQAFQRLMDKVTQDLDFCYVYLDDILIASDSVEEHRDHIRQLCENLKEFGMAISPEKCVLGSVHLLPITIFVIYHFIWDSVTMALLQW